MSDETVVASELPAATDTESAADRFQELLTPEPEKKPKKAPEPAEETAEEEGTEPAEAAPEENADVEETTDAEESVEIPSTINGLAEQFDVDVNDLAAHLTVKVGGEEIPLSDLRDGHMRKSDFNRQMNEVAEGRKALEAQSQQLNGQMSQRMQELDSLVLNLGQQVNGEQVDLNQLLNDDPAEYVRAKARIDSQNQALQQAHQWRMQQQGIEQHEAQQQTANYRGQQQSLLVKAVPELSDPTKAAAFEKDISSDLESRGFSPAEISNYFGESAWDHRQILIARDAAKYNQLKAGEKSLKKKVGKLKRVQKPGSAEDKRSRSTDAKTDALSSMKRRGDDASAVNFIKNLLPG